MKDCSYFSDILKHKVLLLDGGMGTMIQSFKLTEADFRGSRFVDHPQELKSDNDILSLTRPDVISAIHRQYLLAGADIIETNTFNSNAISQSEFNLQSIAGEISEAGARVARQTVDAFMKEHPERTCFVVGSMGPTNKTASVATDTRSTRLRPVDFDQLVAAYTEQTEGLLRGGVDMLMVETVFDTLNAKAALFAIRNVLDAKGLDVPVMVSVTLDAQSRRTLSGQTLSAFWHSIAHARVFSVGMNCSFGAREIVPYIEELSKVAPDVFISCHPNAGMPNADGGYDVAPEEWAEIVSGFVKNKWVNIVGGCCGTNPDFIRALAAQVKQTAGADVRSRGARSHQAFLSGLEMVAIRPEINLINIGERTNVAGSKKFRETILAGEYEKAVNTARHQVENGAQAIDVCMDAALLDAVPAMRDFLNCALADADIARVPVVIDSSKWEVILTGLKCLQGKGIVNSISLKEGEEVFLEHARAISRYGAAVVVMLFDEKGQATTLERKIEICTRAYKLLTEKTNIPPEDIIFDPNVLTIGTGNAEHDNYAVWFIECVRYIKKNLPYAKVSGGISNLSFAFRGNEPLRAAMHTVFLYHARRAGLDMAIVNPAQLGIYDEIEPELRNLLEDLILNRTPDATNALLNYVKLHQVQGVQQSEATTEKWRSLPANERVALSIVKGTGEYIEEDLKEIIPDYPGMLSIVEGPLSEGMQRVGQAFGEGKMFLPQVVNSARVMQKAVNCLEKLMPMDAMNGTSAKRRKVLLATVKGDVHDIGKNIVATVLKCNNYEVIDLGVQVPCEKIVSAAKENQVDAIGLSGLITPSLDEMEKVVRALQTEGLKIPVNVGGATTSATHTAVKLAPLYDAPVVHTADASQVSGVLENLLNPRLRFDYVKCLYEEQELERVRYEQQLKKRSKLSLEQARKNRIVLSPYLDGNKKYPFPMVETLSPSFEELLPFVNWAPFFRIWGFRGSFPDILKNPEAKKLFGDTQAFLKSFLAGEPGLRPRGVFGIFRAYSENETLYVFPNTDGEPVPVVMPRQLYQKPDGTPNYCLADFVQPKSECLDYVGCMMVSSGVEILEKAKKMRQDGDDYHALMLQAVSDRFAEAFAEFTHRRIREIFGFNPEDENVGIRPAPGYPTCPEHQQKEIILKLLDGTKNAGITLTDSFMMVPVSSVSAWVFMHPKATYFSVL